MRSSCDWKSPGGGSEATSVIIVTSVLNRMGQATWEGGWPVLGQHRKYSVPVVEEQSYARPSPSVHRPLTVLATVTPGFKTPEEAHGSFVMTSVTACSVLGGEGVEVVVVGAVTTVVLVVFRLALGAGLQPVIRTASAPSATRERSQRRTTRSSRNEPEDLKSPTSLGEVLNQPVLPGVLA